MKVQEIMTVEVATATPDTTLEDVATMMRDEDTGAIPVVDGDEITGIITDRDIVIRAIAEGKDPVETTVEDILTGNLETIEPDTDVEEAAQMMSRRQIRRLPVVENGRLIGMLSLGDIAVKEHSETAGEALEDVSEGVKRGGRKQATGTRGTSSQGQRASGGGQRGGSSSSQRSGGTRGSSGGGSRASSGGGRSGGSSGRSNGGATQGGRESR